jgi:PAS domain S-box-containing protein
VNIPPSPNVGEQLPPGNNGLPSELPLEYEKERDAYAIVAGSAARLEEANTRTEEANTRTDEANTRTDEANTRTDEANTRTEEAEARSVQAILASEIHYRRLFETAQDGILILDGESGQVVDANPFMKDLLGYSQEEFLGRKLWEIGPFQGSAASKITFAELQCADRVRYEGLSLETKDGQQVEVEFISNAFLVDERRLIQCNIRDIRERRRAEQRATLLNTCISNLNDIVIVLETDLAGAEEPRIVFANAAFERLMGYSFAEAFGQRWGVLEGIKSDPRILKEIRLALQMNQPIRRQIICYAKDGTEHWLDIDIMPIFDGAGQCTHFAVIERDVTKEKKSEEQLLWKTAFFEAQVNSSLDGILVVDGEGKKILQNQQMDDLWKIPAEYVTDMDDQRRLDWVASQIKNPQQFREGVAHLYAHPDQVSRDELDLADGRSFDRYSAPVRGTDAKVYGRIWAFRDVTERKRHEARFRRLVNSNAQGVVFWNAKGEITDANDAFLHLVRYAREDLQAGRIDLAALTPAEYAAADQHCTVEIAAHGVCAPYEKEYIRKDGSRVPILVGAACFEDSPLEGVCFIVDLSERKKLEQQFLRAQRMESIGTLAGGIAHDLNNILAPIMMSIEMLKITSTDPEANVILETISRSAKRGADIVRQVLSFARGVEGERIEVQPKHLLNDLENIIRDTFPKDILQNFSVPNDIWTILGDPTQVHQILLNLCVNARDAMPQGGTLNISVRNSVLDREALGMNPKAVPGRYIHLVVADSGTGIPADLIDKIFEPFFTTKEVNKGTGLGLSTVMAIVKSHSGIINVYSEAGKGTAFSVYLPAMEIAGDAESDSSSALIIPRGRGETVLVVDDEPSILSITNRTLEAFGYHVLSATDGAEAVALYARHQHDIAVVVTDMMMPIMDGGALIRVLTRIDPAVRIIATSGLAANKSGGNPSESNIRHFLTKPYAADVLLVAVRNVLDQP